MLKQTGKVDVGPETYFQVKASEAFVSKVSTKGSEDGSMTQDVEFVFKQIALGYKAQTNKGGLEGSIPFEWSIKEMKLGTDIANKLK